MAYERVLAAYGPVSVALDFLATELGFDDPEECRTFVASKGAVFLKGQPSQLDIKASRNNNRMA